MTTATLATWLAQARETARAAAPGPWEPCAAHDRTCPCGLIWAGEAVVAIAQSHENSSAGEGYTPEQMNLNQRHIARFDPTTALLLLAVAEASARLDEEADVSGGRYRANTSLATALAELIAHVGGGQDDD